MRQIDLKDMKRIRVILLDIAGTITSLDFIEELKGFTRENIDLFLKDNYDHFGVQRCLNEWIRKTEQCYGSKNPSPMAKYPPTKWNYPETEITRKKDLAVNLRNWIDLAMEKYLWIESLCMECAYGSGIKAHLYPDVYPFLRQMAQMNRKIYSYNTELTETAQRLHFEKSIHGDLSNLITDYFMYPNDKTRIETYKGFTKKFGQNPSEILYLTDTVEDARAAQSAGLIVHLVVRPGNKRLNERNKEEFQTIESFEDILI